MTAYPYEPIAVEGYEPLTQWKPSTDWGYGADINMPSDAVLLFRAVSSARPVRDVRRGVPRWRAVMETFKLGSTYATALCERFRLDPEEKVRR